MTKESFQKIEGLIIQSEIEDRNGNYKEAITCLDEAILLINQNNMLKTAASNTSNLWDRDPRQIGMRRMKKEASGLDPFSNLDTFQTIIPIIIEGTRKAKEEGLTAKEKDEYLQLCYDLQLHPCTWELFGLAYKANPIDER